MIKKLVIRENDVGKKIFSVLRNKVIMVPLTHLVEEKSNLGSEFYRGNDDSICLNEDKSNWR